MCTFECHCNRPCGCRGSSRLDVRHRDMFRGSTVFLIVTYSHQVYQSWAPGALFMVHTSDRTFQRNIHVCFQSALTV